MNRNLYSTHAAGSTVRLAGWRDDCIKHAQIPLALLTVGSNDRLNVLCPDNCNLYELAEQLEHAADHLRDLHARTNN